MKKDYRLLMVGIAIAISCNAQMPLPCLVYESEAQLEGFYGQLETHCIEINMGPWWAGIDDNHSRSFEVDEGSISPSTAESDGIVIVPGTDPLSGFQITLRQGGGEDELEAAWFEPTDSYNVPLYEKVEWGIILPAEVQTAIDNWISNDQNGTTLTPAINPFDPEQIDVWAEVKEPNGNMQRVNGFYYKRFERNTSNPDKNYWDWDAQTTEYVFRYRYSPELIGTHLVELKCVTTQNLWQSVPFAFQAMYNDPSKSYLTITPNKHYFQTADGKVVIPVGINHNDLSYSCECEYDVDTDDCESCYPDGDADLCCGIDAPYRRRRGNGDNNNQLNSEMKEKALPLVSYIKRDMQLEQLANSGATAVRVWTDPLVCDIEFEKITNYYERQYQAWEFDKMIEKCHEVNLRIEWCMMMHYMLTQNSDGATRWDWGNTDNCSGISNPGDNGCCYFSEFGQQSPIDFLTDPNAMLAYKKKLRYMIARWGYSSKIFQIDLISEINNVGGGEKWECDDDDGDGIIENWSPHYHNILGQDVNYEEYVPSQSEQIAKPYESNAENARLATALWHEEMARFIKEDLHHRRHLIAADYTGTAPLSDIAGMENANPCEFDFSWNSEFIDVITYSYYKDEPNRWETMARTSYQNLQCSDSQEPIFAYAFIDKPVNYAECGGTYTSKWCDHVDFTKDLLAGCLSGHSTSGMGWNQNRNHSHWYMMGKVDNFINTFLVNEHNLGAENWIPGHEFSADGPIQNNGENDQRAEAIYLQKLDEENPKVIGVIMNRTWNYYTVGKAECTPNEESPFTEGESALEALDEIGWGNEKLRLHNMFNEHYTIRYYDPYTLNEVNEENNHCNDGSLDLENYPLMFDGSNGHHPFYFFVAFKQGEEWATMPILDQDKPEEIRDSSFTSEEEFTNVIVYEDHNELELYAYPNPAMDDINIFAPKSGNYEVYSSAGQLTKTGFLSKGTNCIHISGWTNGLYYLKFIEGDLSTTFIVQR